MGVGDAKFEDAIVDCLGGLDRTDRFFEVNIERPELQRFEESLLNRE